MYREVHVHFTIWRFIMSDMTNAVATGKKRANSVITTSIDGDVMRFAVLGQPTLQLDIVLVSEQNRSRAMLHGFKQRVSDAAAIPADMQTGKPASPREKWEAMKAIVDHLNSGASEWNIKRAEGGFGGVGIVLQAVANLKKTTVEELEKQLAVIAAREGVEFPAIVKRLGGSAAVIREVARLKAERAGVDSDELLDELM
jgi:hypothetical protein